MCLQQHFGRLRLCSLSVHLVLEGTAGDTPKRCTQHPKGLCAEGGEAVRNRTDPRPLEGCT